MVMIGTDQVGVTKRLDNNPWTPDGVSGVEPAEVTLQQVENHGVETLQAIAATQVNQLTDGICADFNLRMDKYSICFGCDESDSIGAGISLLRNVSSILKKVVLVSICWSRDRDRECTWPECQPFTAREGKDITNLSVLANTEVGTTHLDPLFLVCKQMSKREYKMK